MGAGTITGYEAQPRRAWPRLRLADWTDTREALHMWLQIVGKIRMAHAPTVNHWWHVTLYVSPRGLTTSPIPHDLGSFDMEFDFIDHSLRIRTSDGRERHVTLEAKPVAGFYSEIMCALGELSIDTHIHAKPNEVDPAVPFAEDYRHAAYDPRAAQLFWGQLLQADRVIGEFRSRFVGKASPVQFFWGGMDLACSRFSGRPAPPHTGSGRPNFPSWIEREAYTHELASCGFWPGGGEEGAFYAYAYPEPPGFADYPIRPAAAYYHRDLGEYVLPYEAVAEAADPDHMLMEFLDTTYAAVADLADWDRTALETDPRHGPRRTS
ncbi:DUF5996 family protein [Micromonospora lutea]|nr:DUF5996 family protein [Micromonospora lutea]